MSSSFMLILSYVYLTMHSRCVFSNIEEKIIGGTYADCTSAPYMLSFRINGKHCCGAAILTKYWVVTAAHCAMAAKMKNITLCSGITKLFENGNVHSVTRMIIHENYNNWTNNYDIALLQIYPPFTFNSCTKPVDVASDDVQEIFTEYGTACGWGYYNAFIPILSEYLQCIILPLINKELCKKDYENNGFEVTHQMTCYGFQDGRGDTCKGDSGGPLVNKDNILLGITSWGIGCAEKFSPGVYTDTVRLGNWIKANIGKKNLRN